MQEDSWRLRPLGSGVSWNPGEKGGLTRKRCASTLDMVTKMKNRMRAEEMLLDLADHVPEDVQ